MFNNEYDRVGILSESSTISMKLRKVEPIGRIAFTRLADTYFFCLHYPYWNFQPSLLKRVCPLTCEETGIGPLVT